MRENANRIANQVELCREYIRAHYDNELAETAVVYGDEGFSALIEELARLDIAFVSIREQFDTGTP